MSVIRLQVLLQACYGSHDCAHYNRTDGCTTLSVGPTFVSLSAVAETLRPSMASISSLSNSEPSSSENISATVHSLVETLTFLKLF